MSSSSANRRVSLSSIETMTPILPIICDANKLAHYGPEMPLLLSAVVATYQYKTKEKAHRTQKKRKSAMANSMRMSIMPRPILFMLMIMLISIRLPRPSTPLLHLIRRTTLRPIPTLIITIKEASIILLRARMALITRITILVSMLDRALNHAMTMRSFAAELWLDR